MKTHSLRYLRIVAAIIAVLAFIVLFADFTGWGARHLAFLPKVQLVPALLALNIGAIVFLLVLTLIFGRIYCSVLCPFGIMQDFIAWLRRVCGPKQRRRLGFYAYRPERKRWRYAFLSIFILLAAAALLSLLPMSIAGILDPYSSFGRIVSQTAALRFSLSVGIVALTVFLVAAIFAWRTGRGYCNTVCPVGTILGLLSRHSLLKPVIDTDKCNRCGSCGRHCKAECIDTRAHRIDYSRCVMCFDCINNCTQGAISFRRPKALSEDKLQTAPHDIGRRAFMTAVAMTAGNAALSAAGRLSAGAPLRKKQPHKGILRPVPAGAISLRNITDHCTACQLCISACPNQVLRPSTELGRFMQPVMAFTDGYCHTGCTRCSNICPTGALRPVDRAEKASIKIGNAVVDTSICISAAKGIPCGNCARHCPAGAIVMVKGSNGNLRPAVDESRCIGCGSCEYHCPVGNIGSIDARHAAIYVVGLDKHLTL